MSGIARQALMTNDRDFQFLVEVLDSCRLSTHVLGGLWDRMTFYICGNTGVVMCWQPPEAQFIAFHRKGGEAGFLSDCKQLLIMIRRDAKNRGCMRFAALIENWNPRARSLLRFYRRVIGLEPEAIVMRGDI